MGGSWDAGRLSFPSINGISPARPQTTQGYGAMVSLAASPSRLAASCNRFTLSVLNLPGHIDMHRGYSCAEHTQYVFMLSSKPRGFEKHRVPTAWSPRSGRSEISLCSVIRDFRLLFFRWLARKRQDSPVLRPQCSQHSSPHTGCVLCHCTRTILASVQFIFANHMQPFVSVGQY